MIAADEKSHRNVPFYDSGNRCRKPDDVHHDDYALENITLTTAVCHFQSAAAFGLFSEVSTNGGFDTGDARRARPFGRRPPGGETSRSAGPRIILAR